LGLAGGPRSPGVIAQEATGPAAEKAAEKAAEFKALLRQRREALDTALRLLVAQYKSGVVALARVLQAEQAARPHARRRPAADTPRSLRRAGPPRGNSGRGGGGGGWGWGVATVCRGRLSLHLRWQVLPELSP
jgi:hypothetical protein